MFRRSAQNPILTAADMPFPANSVFNPGATQLPDGDVVLLVRIEDRRGLSSIHVARSADGITNWLVDPEPLLQPDETQISWQWGFEDARVSFVDELDRYVITCTAYGPPGPCVYLAITTDFGSIEQGSIVIPPEDKNAALFPRRVNGQWLLLHRPVVATSGAADIWMSRSPDDLESWRHPQQVMTRRPGGWWDAARIGIGPPPIETSEGWLLIYHGVRSTMSGAIYRVGGALLDLDEPWVVRQRCDHWLLSPTEPYERTGDVGNVVFPCGAVHRPDDDRLDIYYGGADTVVCHASASISELVDHLVSPDSGTANSEV